MMNGLRAGGGSGGSSNSGGGGGGEVREVFLHRGVP